MLDVWWRAYSRASVQPFVEQSQEQAAALKAPKELGDTANDAQEHHQDEEEQLHEVVDTLSTATPSTPAAGDALLAEFHAFQVARFNELVLDQPRLQIVEAAALIEEEWLSTHPRLPITYASQAATSSLTTRTNASSTQAQPQPQAEPPQAKAFVVDTAPALTATTVGAAASPKNPVNPYRVFANERRAAVKSLRPELSYGEINNVLLAEWRNKTDAEKQRYSQKFARLFEQYKRELAHASGATVSPTSGGNHAQRQLPSSFEAGKKSSVPASTNKPKAKAKAKGAPEAVSSDSSKDKAKRTRAVSAYDLFCKSERASIRQEMPHLSLAEVGRLLGQRWREITPERKQVRAYESARPQASLTHTIAGGMCVQYFEQEKEKLRTTTASSASATATATGKAPASKKPATKPPPQAKQRDDDDGQHKVKPARVAASAAPTEQQPSPAPNNAAISHELRVLEACRALGIDPNDDELLSEGGLYVPEPGDSEDISTDSEYHSDSDDESASDPDLAPAPRKPASSGARTKQHSEQAHHNEDDDILDDEHDDDDLLADDQDDAGITDSLLNEAEHIVTEPARRRRNVPIQPWAESTPPASPSAMSETAASTADAASAPATPQARPFSSSGLRVVEAQSPKVAPKELLLAHTWTDDVDPSGWWMSEKMDGVRAYWSGRHFFSRNGKVAYAAPAWFTECLPKVALDGELCAGRGTFQRSLSIVSKKSPDPDSWRAITFHIFDAPEHEQLRFEQRLEVLQQLLGAGTETPAHVRLLTHTRCRDREHLRQELAAVEAQHGEGLMLRQPGSFYERKRSHTLLKVKSVDDAEALVVGYFSRPGGRDVSSLECEMPDGKRFYVDRKSVV